MLLIKAQRERRIGRVHAPLSSSAFSVLLGCSHGELFMIILNDVAMGRRQEKSCSETLCGWETCLPRLWKLSKVFEYEKLSRKDRGPGEVMSTDENVKGTLRCSYFQIQWFLYL